MTAKIRLGLERLGIDEAARIEAEQGRLAQWEEICRAPIVGIDIWYEYENSPRGHCECSACRQQREMYPPARYMYLTLLGILLQGHRYDDMQTA